MFHFSRLILGSEPFAHVGFIIFLVCNTDSLEVDPTKHWIHSNSITLPLLWAMSLQYHPDSSSNMFWNENAVSKWVLNELRASLWLEDPPYGTAEDKGGMGLGCGDGSPITLLFWKLYFGNNLGIKFRVFPLINPRVSGLIPSVVSMCLEGSFQSNLTNLSSTFSVALMFKSEQTNSCWGFFTLCGGAYLVCRAHLICHHSPLVPTKRSLWCECWRCSAGWIANTLWRIFCLYCCKHRNRCPGPSWLWCSSACSKLHSWQHLSITHQVDERPAGDCSVGPRPTSEGTEPGQRDLKKEAHPTVLLTLRSLFHVALSCEERGSALVI